MGCKEAKKESTVQAATLQEETAREYAMEAQRALGQTLQKKIASEGAEAAIAFCNVRAIPITDSTARANGVRIQRVTNRPRNPVNRASDAETRLITQMADSLGMGNVLSPIRIAEGDSTHYYFPILTNAMCMKCHGDPQTEISPEVLGRLQMQYPEDLAYPYKINELRGLWKISFNPTHQNQNP